MREADEKENISLEYILRYLLILYAIFLFSSVFIGNYIYTLLQIRINEWFVSPEFLIMSLLGMLMFISVFEKRYLYSEVISIVSLVFSWILLTYTGNCDQITPALISDFRYIWLYFAFMSIVFSTILLFKYQKEPPSLYVYPANIVLFLLFLISSSSEGIRVEVESYELLYISIWTFLF